jgi:hypothetical protein
MAAGDPRSLEESRNDRPAGGSAPMKGSVAALAILLAAGAVRADQLPPPLPPPSLLVDSRDPAWQSLFARLAAGKNREADFEERRTFLFRKTPVVLTGTIRMSPGRGMSLCYVTPEPRILIADDQGLVLREPGRRDVDAAAGGRAQAATAVLIDVIRFNLPELRKAFEFRGRRSGDGWILALRARTPSLMTDLDSIVISGEGAQLRRIELIGSATRSVDIFIGRTREDVRFTREDLIRYFR